MVLNHLELFAGIGGFSLALRNVYQGKINTYYSEIDKHAIKIYQKHFPDAINYGDIRTIRPGQFPQRLNLITFGFPCQDISIAGKRMGFKGGKRSSLFFEAIRIIDAERPEYFLAENVKGFFSSHEGEDFLVALRTITDIGYDCQWQLLNTKWFLPQNRERVFIIGYIRGTARPEIFPIGESIAQSSAGNEEEVATTLDRHYLKDETGSIKPTSGFNSNQSEFILVSDSGFSRKKEEKEIVPPLRSNTGVGSNNKIIYRKTGKERKTFGTLQATEKGAGDHSQQDLIESDATIRRLTPIECERLQGFPDNYTEGLSDTQRYKTLGNAISVPVVEEIFRRLYANRTK